MRGSTARVSRQAQTLDVLNEIAIELTSILDLGPLLERVGQLLRRLIDYQMFTIMLLDAKGETLVTRYAWRFGYAHAPSRRISINERPGGRGGARVAAGQRARCAQGFKRYLPMNPETRSELIVPLFYKGRIIGVLDLEHTRTASSTKSMSACSPRWPAQIAIAIENARLYQAVTAAGAATGTRHRDGARSAAAAAAADRAGTQPNAEIAVRFLPARTIGGDLYDFVEYGDRRTAIVLGDVSGKAAPAALFAALASGIMRSAAAAKTGAGGDAGAF